MKNPKWYIPPGLDPTVEKFIALYKTVKNTPIMILGPSGVGKSLFLHIFEELKRKETQNRKSSKKPVRLNCATLPKHLISSELFGYEKGAFTGAEKRKTGLVEEAENTLLVLEEVGELAKKDQCSKQVRCQECTEGCKKPSANNG